MRKEFFETLGLSVGRTDANAGHESATYAANADFNPLMKQLLTAHVNWAASS